MARSSVGTDVILSVPLVSPGPRASRPFDLGVRSAATAAFLSATATRSRSTLVGQCVCDCARLRGSQRPRCAAPRSVDGGAGRQACGAARGLCAGCRQIDAQPAGAEPACAERYHKISHNPVAIRHLFVDLFLEAHGRAPRQIILDLDATDDPVRRAGGAVLPRLLRLLLLPAALVFCGEHLLLAKLRSASLDAAAVARLVARPCPLAAHAHSVARGLGLCAR
jgi:hypothetical protein